MITLNEVMTNKLWQI